MNPPCFQFYPADFLADENVVAMTNQQVGCYFKLICYCWREGSIPDDVARLALLCGETPEEMALLWSAIKMCFKVDSRNSGRLLHPRLERERLKQKKYKSTKSAAGKLGAKSRWGNKKQELDCQWQTHGSANGKAIADASQLPLANDSSSSSSSSSDIIVPPLPPCGGNGEVRAAPPPEEKTGQDVLPPKRESRANAIVRVLAIPIPEVLDSPPFREAWTLWVNSRLRNHKLPKDPVPMFAIQLRTLAGYSAENAQAVVRQAVAGNYQGLPQPRANLPAGPPQRPQTVHELRTIFEAKERSAAALRRRHCAEVATGDQWTDEGARQEWIRLRREMRELNDRIGKFPVCST